MAPASIPGAYDWGNPYHLLLRSVLGTSLCHKEGLGALFFFGRGAAHSENQAKFVLTIEVYIHHTRAPPRTSNSANLVHGNHPCETGQILSDK